MTDLGNTTYWFNSISVADIWCHDLIFENGVLFTANLTITLELSVHDCKLKLSIRMFSLLERVSKYAAGFTTGLPRGDIIITGTDMGTAGSYIRYQPWRNLPNRPVLVMGTKHIIGSLCLSISVFYFPNYSVALDSVFVWWFFWRIFL